MSKFQSFIASFPISESWLNLKKKVSHNPAHRVKVPRLYHALSASIFLPVLDVAHAVLDLAPLLRRHLPLVERGQQVGRGLLGVVDQPPVGDDLVVEGLGPVQLQRGVSLVELGDFGTGFDSSFDKCVNKSDID